MIIVSKLRYRLLFANPFKPINKMVQPTAEEKLSQKQMLPAVLLYKILIELDHGPDQAHKFVAHLVQTLAFSFLKFTIPIINRKRVENLPLPNQLKILTSITKRFFNAQGKAEMNSKDRFSFTVSKCSFAQYSTTLGVPELAPIFCASDKAYFDTCQTDITLERTTTLAEDHKPCDFVFHWKDSSTHE
ncbi:MAG: L-2-amino-thiazoline-4-carboxylic acid hydrolase [Myxococcota bacterium]|nr:L-2-amino-thiazoline-4-carboxylic acid hydrolase [Myxococcota bacterium]